MTRRLLSARTFYGLVLVLGAGFLVVAPPAAAQGTADSATLVLEQRIAPGGSYDQGFAYSGIVDATLHALTPARTVSGLAPGAYAAVAADPGPNFALTRLRCDDAESTGDLGTRTATFRVSAGEIVRCRFTYTDRRTGTIVLEQRIAPGGSYDSAFSYTGIVDEALPASVPARTISGLLPGAYAATAADPGDDFDLTDLRCDDSDSTTDAGTATFRVADGETVRCRFTYTDRRTGTLILEQRVAPGGSYFDQEFTYTGVIGETLDARTAARTVSGLLPGTYTATAGDPGANFELSDLRCDDADSGADLQTRTATFRVADGETVRCRFTYRDRRTGTVILEQRLRSGGFYFDQSFTYTGIVSETLPASIPARTVGGLVAGTYVATGADPGPNFRLTDLRCDDADSAGDLGSRTATFRVDDGETVRCRFTYTDLRAGGADPMGSLILEQQMETDASGVRSPVEHLGRSFGGVGPCGAVPSIGNAHLCLGLHPGETYAVVFGDPGADFEMVRLACDDAGSARPSEIDRDARTIRVNAEAGEQVHCVATYRDLRAVLILDSQMEPDASGARSPIENLGRGFGGGGPCGAVPPAGHQQVCLELTPGTTLPVAYTDPGPNYVLTSLQCDDAGSPRPSTVDLSARRLAVNVDAEEVVECSATYRDDRALLILEGQMEPDASGERSPVENLGHRGDGIGPCGALPVAGQQQLCFDLSPGGTYPVAFVDPRPAFRLARLACDDAASPRPSTADLDAFAITVRTDAAELVQCLATYRDQRSRIVLEKQLLPGSAPGGAAFDGFGCAFSITGGQSLLCTGYVPGVVTVTERDPAPEYRLASITCDDAESATPSTHDLSQRSATYAIDPDETVTCVFTNGRRDQPGTIIVEKRTDPADTAPTPAVFGFTAPGLEPSSFALSHGQARRIDGVPPGEYAVTESASSHQLTALDCDDGASTSPSTTSTGTRTATVRLDAGETVRCVFTNRLAVDTTPPVCTIDAQGRNADGRGFIRFRVRDAGGGLSRYEVVYRRNATVVVDQFTPGTTSPVFITATAVNPALSLGVTVDVFDVAGNRAICDPIVLVMSRVDSQPEDVTFTDVPASDSKVTVVNGAPGMRKVRLIVNGVGFKERDLEDGEVRKFDIASAMRPGSRNTVTVRARGKKGATAVIVIADIP